jgi:endoglucanase
MPTLQAPDTLLTLSRLPTVAGRERHVVRALDDWLAQRPSLRKTTDDAGNILIRSRDEPASAPILFTAHLDHPGFAVESITSDRAARLAFRGGVHPHYFNRARVILYPADPDSKLAPVRATITEHEDPDPPARLDRVAAIHADESLEGFTPADIAVWDLPEPSADGTGLFHARVCDDLAALAAALDALDQLLETEAAPRVGLLCTRAEEVGFTGAIAACRSGLIPKDARLLALENSRSFPDSPLHAGPIVRVGDRISTFSPTLNAAVARCAQQLAGKTDPAVGRPKIEPDADFKWQRKLMPGGACEATAFYAFGYEATCLCLPLGNYHNMAGLTEYEQSIKAGEEPRAEIDREFISLEDYHGLVKLLVACGQSLEAAEPITDRLDKLYDQRKHILTER